MATQEVVSILSRLREREDVPEEISIVIEDLVSVARKGEISPEVGTALGQFISATLQQIESQGRSAAEILRPEFVNETLTVEGNLNQAARDVNNAARDILHVVINFAPESLSNDSSEKFRIPTVLVVMDLEQATRLSNDTENVFANEPALLQDFQALDGLLNDQGFSDWPTRYGNTSRDWRPWLTSTPNETIEQKIQKYLGQIPDYGRLLEPEFHNIQNLIEPLLLATDEAVDDVIEMDSRRTLTRLRREGCIVIIDVISMRYPDLQRYFHRSLLDAFPNTISATIAPADDVHALTQQLPVALDDLAQIETLRRRYLDQDPKTELLVGNRWRALQELVVAKVPDLVPEDVKSGGQLRSNFFKG